jgi:nicotinamidase-related amidase
MAEATSCEPISHAVHLCIDMQNIFSSAGIWPTPWMDRVLPGIVRLVAHDPARTVFTRFVTPNSAHDRPGRWQRYFTRWDCATRPRLPAGALDFVSPLARFIPPAAVIDKPAPSLRAPCNPSSQKRKSAASSSRGRRRMSACWRRCSMLSTMGTAWSWSRTVFAARPTRATTP